MKKLLISLPLLALLIATACSNQRPDHKSAQDSTATRTLSSFDPPTPGEKLIAAQTIKFEQADLAEVLNLYAQISGRSVIRGGNVPDVKITFSNQKPMSAVEALQALDTVLAAEGITTVFLGTQYVKVVPEKFATTEPGPVIELPPDQLPDSSSFLIYIVKLKNVPASRASAAVTPFAKLPASIIAVGSPSASRPSSKTNLLNLPVIFGAKENNLLILRDYSSNVRRMLQVLEKLEQQ